MSFDRAAIFAEALAELEVPVGRTTRYANDTGTCFWCAGGALLMVPDDPKLEWFCQAQGSEELQARLAPVVGPRLEEAARETERLAQALQVHAASLSPAQRELVHLGERLRREGYEEGLEQARRMFAGILSSKFGPLPPMVQRRIETAGFDQLQRWSGRVFSVPRAILVVA